METKNLDIVYVVKRYADNDELRYSLRSLQNLPHRKVFICGHKPDWTQEVEHIPYQGGHIKWKNTSEMYQVICEDERVSENFILFNDDFFVLKPLTKLGYFYDRSLSARAEQTRCKYLWHDHDYSQYGHSLLEAERMLKEHKLPTKNFELHIPMIFNKKKFLEVLGEFPDAGFAARRSLYGNYWKIRAEEMKDVKVEQPNSYWAAQTKDDFVSTSNVAFRNGTVGNMLRRQFKEPSEYEM